MKQYKYKINGNLYNVTVNDVEDNIANVEVNGTSYKVELDKPVKAAPKPVTRPAAASENGNRCSGSNQTTDSFQKRRCEISASGRYPRHKSERRGYREERSDDHHP